MRSELSLVELLRRVIGSHSQHSGGLSGRHAFSGGLALARDKPGLDSPIVDVSLPTELIFPLLRYRAVAARPMVTIGQRVKAGQRLGDDVLASASGTVTAIEQRPVPHPSGKSALCVVVTPDAAGEQPSGHPEFDAIDELTLDRLCDAGVGGLGGAGFPLHGKLRNPSTPIHTLVINAAECEPGIACDEATMRAWPSDIIAGCQRVANLLGNIRCVIVIESDKHAAATALRDALNKLSSGADDSHGEQGQHHGDQTPDSSGSRNIEIIDVPPVYPSGAEALTVRLATGIVLNHGERPVDRGILCINVATALAAERACRGHAQLQRIVTVSDDRSGTAYQVRVTFGTPVEHVLAETGMLAEHSGTRLRIGGPLSGFNANDTAIPVTATVNRIARESTPEAPSMRPCIRCAACSDVCPVDLLPQELYRHARVSDGDALEHYGLQACLTCGCCDLVCPSAIPLTSTFRYARDVQLELQRQRQNAHDAELRYHRREARQALPAEKSADPVAAALARVRGRRRARPDTRSDNPSGKDSSNAGAEP